MPDMNHLNPKPILGSLVVLLCALLLAPASAAQDPEPEKQPEKRKGTYYDNLSRGHGDPRRPSAPEPVDVAAAPRISWTSSGGGSWSDAANWSGGTVPGEDDHAVIDLEGTYTVVLDAETRLTALSLGAASGTQTLSIPEDSLVLAGPSTIGPQGVVELTGGIITGSGDLVVHGEVQWSSGAMSGRGKARIEPGGRFALTGEKRKVLSLRHVENSGTMVWSGAGNLVVTFAARIVNQEGASFEISTGALLDVYGPAGPEVHNAGTLRVVSETAPRFETPLVNSGTLDLARGGLHLLDSYTGDGEVLGDGKLEGGVPTGKATSDG